MEKITLHTGDVIVSSKPVIMETILGSCVSVCLWDNKLNIGGMNHFMLPYVCSYIKNSSYSGIESIKRLVSDIQRLGANLHNLRAKIFGGCGISDGYFVVGKENIRLANEMLMEQGIPILKEFTMCEYGIKVIFCTATGRAFVKILQDEKGDMQNTELSVITVPDFARINSVKIQK